ncbi:vicilin GC72-A [Prunus yedoensis var. nudiflora]|uniref:Vicilin GC72-A n=1 Tax=Prunus yedoensis var. nudiflora TaxID=2094558 RepID=A0A314Z0N4_PRUYE|nr:vicilin GC72-A [Prunus yedoensis var. nudiflora]
MVIHIKPRLPLFLFLSLLFLAFSVSFTLGQDREQQCQKQCQDFKRPVIHSECIYQCKKWGPWSLPPAESSNHHKQQQQHEQQQQCQQHCQSQRGHRQQQQCQQECHEQIRQQKEREEMQQMCQQRCEMQGSGDQQQQRQQCQRQCEQQVEQLKQCQLRCQMQGQGQQQEQCQRTCRQELEDQQRRQPQEQGPGGGDNKLEDETLNGEPRRRFEQCMQGCERQQQGQGEQEQCPRQCREQYDQEKRQYQQCKQSCEKSSQPDDEKHQCKQQCKQQISQQQGGGNQEEDDDALNGSGYGGAKERFEQCKLSCQSQQGQGQQEQCPKQCKQQFEHEKHQYKQCKRDCQKQARDDDQKEQCKQQCAQQMSQQQGQQQGQQQEGSTGGGGPNQQQEEEGQMGSQGQSQSNNPFYFPSHRFQPRFQSNEGGLYVLERFTQRQSELLRGIKNYRLAIFEARPNTFVLPHHCDAEAIYVVLSGQCTCTLLMQDRKESFNMEHGDVIRVPAGATTYLVNNNNDETLRIAKLLQPVNNPGRFEEFFPAGSGNPESYFSVFSNDILESAFNTPREQLEHGFKQGQQKQGQGIVMRAPREQLQALSQAASSRRRGDPQSQGPFNLRQQRPVHSNNYGQFFEARPEEFNQLQDMDASVSCIEINQQAMMVPHFNSKATHLIMVVEGNGLVEMACPCLASQRQEIKGQQEQQGEQNGRHMKVTAQLSPGDVFVIPAGHPVAFVAQNQNLRILGFGLNAQNNMRNFLAGQEDNILMQMDREARQLAFGPEMEQIFSKQQQSYFVPTQQGRSRNHHLSSVLEFAGII